MLGNEGSVHGIECLSSRLEQARSNMRTLKERLPPEHLVRGLLGDAATALAGAKLSLTNVLIPECTDGQLYDAIYCDTTLSEEDLPAFLSLLKPQVRPGSGGVQRGGGGRGGSHRVVGDPWGRAG